MDSAGKLQSISARVKVICIEGRHYDGAYRYIILDLPMESLSYPAMMFTLHTAYTILSMKLLI